MKVNGPIDLYDEGGFNRCRERTFAYGLEPIPGTARVKTPALAWILLLVILAAMIGYAYYVITSLPG